MHPNYFHALMRVAERRPQVFVSGSGSWLVDETGRRYLDFVQGWATNCLGHSPPELAQALGEQARRLINCSPAFFNEPAARLAHLIAAHSCFDQVFFCTSGAEANEGAITLARKWGAKHRGGAFEIITFDNAFHGRTLATMSASGKAQWNGLFEPGKFALKDFALRLRRLLRFWSCVSSRRRDGCGSRVCASTRRRIERVSGRI